MKYLKKFESESWGFDIELAKDILVELKHEYPNIDGRFEKNEGSNGGTLALMCKQNYEYDQSILGKLEYDIDYIKKKNKFIANLSEIIERLGESLNRRINVLGLYKFDEPSSDGVIKIFIMHKE